MKFTKILLLTTLFALQSYLIRFSIGPYPSNLLEVLITLTGLTAIIENPRILAKLKNHWIIASFLGLSALASLIPEIHSQIDLIRHWKFLVFGSALVFLFIETLTRKDQREKAMLFLCYGALIFGIYSAIYNLLGYNNTFDHRLIGPLDAAVYLAYYMAPLTIYSILKTLTTKSKNEKIKYLVLAAPLSILLLFTKSMGAIGSVFLITLAFLTKKYGKHLIDTKVKKALVLFSITILSIAIYQTKIKPTLETTYSSLDERKEIYLTSQYLIKQEPIRALTGLGFGQFQYYYENNVETAINNNALDYYVLQPHNIFLLFLFNYGALGLIFIITIITLTLKNLYTLNIKNEKLIYSFTLCYFFIHGILDTPFYKNDLLFLFILLISLSISKSKALGSFANTNADDKSTP